LAELRGQVVRLAVVGLCWTEDPDGRLHPYGWLALERDAAGEVSERQQLQLPTSPCDGLVHVSTSEPLTLADWFDASTPPMRQGEWLTLTAVAGPEAPDPAKAAGEHAERWLVFVTADAAADPAELEAAVAQHLPPLQIR
jgi:hypothetical protein